MRRILHQTFALLSSFGLTVVVLSFLLLLVVIGTLEQAHESLFEVQRRYFEAAFVVHRIAGIPVPLPGVYLLLIVLSVNLICGGMVRIRKAKTTVGVMLAHVGVLVMFAGSAVEYYCSEKGHASIPEGETTAEFTSYYEWEIAIAEPKKDAPVVEHLIPGEKFMHLADGASATFTSAALPFDLVVHDPLPNCEPRPSPRGVDGFLLARLDREKEAENDTAGVYVKAVPKSGGAPVSGVLWARERFPMSVDVDGRRFTVDLSHRRFPMPFAVHLDDFRREMHPGMGLPKSFESDVTKIQNGVPQQVKISMNEPLRQNGYTLYQSQFREPSSFDDRWWSVFSVVKNPADKVPLIACLIITSGLLFHFVQKLVRHVRAQAPRRA